MTCRHKPKSYKQLMCFRIRAETCYRCGESIILKDGEEKRGWWFTVCTVLLIVMQHYYYVYGRDFSEWKWYVIILMPILTILLMGWYIACRFIFKYVTVSDESSRLPRIKNKR